MSTASPDNADAAAEPVSPLADTPHGDTQQATIEVVTGPVLRDWPAALASHRRRIELRQPLVRVGPIDPGESHPGRPPDELGCFAAVDIKPGTVVGQYQSWVESSGWAGLAEAGCFDDPLQFAATCPTVLHLLHTFVLSLQSAVAWLSLPQLAHGSEPRFFVHAASV